MFEAVGIPALFAAQVDEEVRGPGGVLGRHVPHDAEGVTGHLTNLDVARGGERGVHFCHLPLKREIKKKKEKKKRRLVRGYECNMGV